MINFRFHIVSIVAVFLALGVGVLVGSTVVDQATVARLEENLQLLKGQRDARNATISSLRGELDRWQKFSEQGKDRLIADRLTGVPVLLVVVDGVDRGPVEEFRDWLPLTGASFQGTLWLTDKFGLKSDSDTRRLAELVGTTETDPAGVRRHAVEAVANTVNRVPQPATRALLPGLLDAGFLRFDAPSPAVNVATLLPAGGRIMVISGTGAKTPDKDVALVLTKAMVAANTAPVVAAESGRDGKAPDGKAWPRAVFVGAVRQDDTLSGRLSTIDHLDLFVGKLAATLALADLGDHQFGNYGVGRGASQLVPGAAG